MQTLGLPEIRREQTMIKRLILLPILLGAPVLAGCVPVAVGVAGAVVADEIVEDRQGGDGLF